MRCTFISRNETREESLRIETLIIAGWTGRDREAIETHIHELGELGVPPPSQVPMFYPVSASLLTTANVIEVVASTSSGEVEPLLVRHRGALWVGIASDHTDRALETVSVHKSKQVCPKPIGSTFWLLDDLKGHWDAISLRSWLVSDSGRHLYQHGLLSANRTPFDLCAEYERLHTRALPTALFCGTLPVQGDIRGTLRFEMEMTDPVIGRTIWHAYDVIEYPERA